MKCDYHCVDDDIDRILLWCEDENYLADRSNQITNQIMWAAVFAEKEREERRRKTEEEGRRRKKEEVRIVKSVGEERWIKHYSSRHRILLVGDGDFSFSACLAVAFGSSATNIIATSLDSIAFLKKNYGRAMSNIAELRSRGSKAMHEIDATEIANHELLRRLQFDRIIFNFPFAGFFPDLSPECQLRCHRSLVSQFLENARICLVKMGRFTYRTRPTVVTTAGSSWKALLLPAGLGLLRLSNLNAAITRATTPSTDLGVIKTSIATQAKPSNSVLIKQIKQR